MPVWPECGKQQKVNWDEPERFSRARDIGSQARLRVWDFVESAMGSHERILSRCTILFVSKDHSVYSVNQHNWETTMEAGRPVQSPLQVHRGETMLAS